MSARPVDFFKVGVAIASAILEVDASDDPPVPELREVVFRMAVGRLYYALLNEADRAARSKGYEPPLKARSKGSHYDLWVGWFDAGGHKGISARANQLRRIRVHADYELAKDFDYDAAEVVALAKELAQLIIDYKDSP